jgi:hypothetical protein
MKPEGSLPCSQEPTTSPYLDNNLISYFSEIHLILSPTYL